MKEIIYTKTGYFILAILILAGSFRFYKIDYQSLWADELHSIISTAPEKSVNSIIEYCKSDQPPVSFLYLHAVFKVFPYNEFVGRMACAVIGLISIIVMYFLGKEAKSKEVGILAAFLTSINFFHLYYSQELRFYTMTFFLSALSYLFFIKAYKQFSVLWYLFYVVSTILLLYTHYFGLFVFGAQAVAFVWLVVKEKRYWLFPYGVGAGLLTCLAYIPWMTTLLNDLTIPVENSWIKPPSPVFVAEYFYDYTGKDAFATVVFVVFIYLFVKGMIEDKAARGIYLILVLWIALCYLVPYVRSLTSTPILHSRYTIIVLPAWLLVFALGWERITNMRTKTVLAAMLFVSFLINLQFFKKYYTQISKDQFRECAQFVQKVNKEHYPMYAHPPLAWHFNYYFRDQPYKVITLTERKVSGKCWLLQGHFSEEYKDVILNMMSQEYVFLEKHKFVGADAILMQAKKDLPQ